MRKKWLAVLALTIAIVFFGADIYKTYGLEELSSPWDKEVKFIKSEFEKMAGINPLYSDEYLQPIRADMARMIQNAPRDFLSESQFFVYVDRNPKKQLIALCFFDAYGKQIKMIGADKVSTGNPNRKGFFITPVGFFKNTTEYFGYRALGTKNDAGWRGLGIKGSRV